MKSEQQLYDQQSQILDRLSKRADAVLRQHGKAEHGDYLTFEDYWGYPQIKISISNLRLLEPAIISRLQETLDEFPGWEVVIAVAVPGHYDDWPDMGLIIRKHEIIDGLRREYFPKEFQNLQYQGGRRGTDRD